MLKIFTTFHFVVIGFIEFEELDPRNKFCLSLIMLYEYLKHLKIGSDLISLKNLMLMSYNFTPSFIMKGLDKESENRPNNRIKQFYLFLSFKIFR